MAPAKLVGKFFTSIDKSINRMIGSAPLPPTREKEQQHNEHNNFSMTPKVTGSQSTMAMSTLMPSASEETVTDKSNFYTRSVSVPNFGSGPKQVITLNSDLLLIWLFKYYVNFLFFYTYFMQAQPSNAESLDMKTKAPTSGGSSRFGSFGSVVFQKTFGWVSKVRSDKQVYIYIFF